MSVRLCGHRQGLRPPSLPAHLSGPSLTSARASGSLKGVRPPVEFGEWTRDCSPGHAGKDSSATPSFPSPSQPEGKIGLPRANPRGRLMFLTLPLLCISGSSLV